MRLLVAMAALMWACASIAEVYSDVHRYSRALADIAAAGNDIIVAMKKVGINAETLFKLGGPVSSLIGAAISGAIGPESDEMRAIKSLYASMTKSFYDLNIQLQDSTALLYDTIWSIYYKLEVTGPLSDLFDDFEFAQNGSSDNFVGRCKNRQTNSILNRLKNAFVVSCPLPKVNDIENFITWYGAFADLETDHQELLWNQDYKSMKSEILARTGSVDSAYRLEFSANHTSEFILDELRTFIEELGVPNDFLLATVNRVHSYDRAHLLALVHTLKTDLIKTATMTVACANFSAESKPQLEFFLAKSAEKISLITNHVAAWVTRSQELAWPNITMAIVKRNLDAKTVPIEQFNSTAVFVKEEFEKRGRQREVVCVIVSQNRLYETNWIVQSLSNDSHSVHFTSNDIIVYVFRVKSGAHHRVYRANRWFRENREVLTNQMRKIISESSAKDALEMMQLSFGPLTRNDTFRSVLLTKDDKYFWRSPKIFQGAASVIIVDVPITVSIAVESNGFHSQSMTINFIA